MLALKLPKHIEQSLENLAKKKGRTLEYYARKAIVAMIEDEKDLAAVKAALKDDGPRITLEEYVNAHPEIFGQP